MPVRSPGASPPRERSPTSVKGQGKGKGKGKGKAAVMPPMPSVQGRWPILVEKEWTTLPEAVTDVKLQ